MEYCLAFIFLTCLLTVMAQHSKLEPGMPGNDAPPGTHKMSFKPPNLDQEQQWSQHMPSTLTCEACKVITHNVSTFISWFIYIRFIAFWHGWELHNTQRTPLLAMASDATQTHIITCKTLWRCCCAESGRNTLSVLVTIFSIKMAPSHCFDFFAQYARNTLWSLTYRVWVANNLWPYIFFHLSD